MVADIENNALNAASASLHEDGLNVVGIQADVSSPDSMIELEAASRNTFGNIHSLCNNAGVGINGDQMVLGSWG